METPFRAGKTLSDWDSVFYHLQMLNVEEAAKTLFNPDLTLSLSYRIGQDKNVMVHKFVSRGSVEEKIDAMIASKRELAENVIGSGGENWITELSNEELLSVLRLD